MTQQTETLPFRNPYGHADKGTTSRITVDVATSDYNLIKCVRPAQHTLSATVGTLWQKLTTKLRQDGITDISKINEFEHFIANCVILSRSEYDSLVNGRGLSNCAAGSVGGQACASDERRGTQSVRPGTARISPVAPVLPRAGRKAGAGKTK